jgi:protein O-GlcNAcase/histone acetyltransferase
LERQELFGQMAEWGLSTYMYAPKDDLKHRAIWREPYSAEELEDLAGLIGACRQHGLRFIYALSPGLDITYSEAKDHRHIQDRWTQLMQAGCDDFALLFDDIPAQLRPSDRDHFDSFAEAQSAVANEVFRWLHQQRPQSRCLFCPTAYCDRMARRQLGGAGYVETVGERLNPAIDVLWTGPEIVSSEITLDSINQVRNRLGRAPVLWDNLHANDYDLRRLYCGPYSGRPLELRQALRGILANPNNEFPANYVPLRTLAGYVQSGEEWDPRQAYLEAMASWLDQFGTIGKPISREDLILMGDCFYLPHTEGPEANRVHDLILRLLKNPPEEWGEHYPAFLDVSGRIQSLFERLTELRRRDLFYTFSRRMWELKEEMQLFEAYFKARREDSAAQGGFSSGDHLAGTYRGGLAARLQQLLWRDPEGRFWPRNSGNEQETRI